MSNLEWACCRLNAFEHQRFSTKNCHQAWAAMLEIRRKRFGWHWAFPINLITGVLQVLFSPLSFILCWSVCRCAVSRIPLHCSRYMWSNPKEFYAFNAKFNIGKGVFGTLSIKLKILYIIDLQIFEVRTIPLMNSINCPVIIIIIIIVMGGVTYCINIWYGKKISTNSSGG